MWLLLGSILGAFAKLLSLDTLKFIATRALLYTLFTLVLPVILYNVFALIMTHGLNYISSQASSEGLEGIIISLTGIAAYLAVHLNIPQAVSILLSAAGLHWIISMIKH